ERPHFLASPADADRIIDRIGHTEEILDIVGMRHIGHGLAVPQGYFMTVQLRTVTVLGNGGIFPAVALAVFVLKLGELDGPVESRSAVIVHRQLPRLTAFGRDHDGSVLAGAAVKGRRRGAFQDGHAFDIVGVDYRNTAAPVPAAKASAAG